MKILNVKTKGFRAFEDIFETKLYDITNITGANRKGKTNILHAIVWCFLGTSISGDDKIWLGNKKIDECYVEIQFIDNSENIHTLIRYKDRYSNKKSFISLDNKIVKQEDLLNYYQDKKLFLSIINQNYFLSKSPTDQKALIDKYLPELDIKEIFEKLDDSDKKILGIAPSNINLLLDDLNDEKKFLENKIKNLQGKIDYANQIVYQKIEDKKTFEKEEELSLCLQEFSFLRTNNSSSDKEEIKSKIDNLKNTAKQLNEKIESLRTKFLQEKQKYISIRDSEDEICPTCLQKLNSDSKLNTLENMKENIINLHTERNKLESELKDINFNLNAENCKYNIVCKSEPTDTIKRMQELNEQVKSLEEQKAEIIKFNSLIDAKIEQINKAKNDISNFQAEISNARKNLELNKESKKIAQKLYINYIEEKMKFANKHLKKVSIKFYSTLKETGEIKEDFIITYDKNELKNLSRSETIATAIEIANMFNKISGVNIPLFIDDSESCQDFNFEQDYYSKDTQIIIAKVIKGENLKISDNLNKVRQTQNDLEEMQKAA